MMKEYIKMGFGIVIGMELGRATVKFTKNLVNDLLKAKEPEEETVENFVHR